MSPRRLSLLCSCIVLAAALVVCLVQSPAPEFAPSPHSGKNEPRHPSSRQARAADTLPSAERPAPDEASLQISKDFLQNILSAGSSKISIPVPKGQALGGIARKIQRDESGPVMVEGTITHPEPGRFYFRRQSIAGKAGEIFGFIQFDKNSTAYQVRPSGPNGSPMLVRTHLSEVMCRSFAAPPEVSSIPATHPTDDPVPASENGVIQLQSLPGAEAVVYLDFDGEQRDFEFWGPINAAPSGASNPQIFRIWQGVCEDFMPFNINITTIRAVYEAAAPGHRMQVVVTPTDDAQEGAGGVAITNSFNNTGEIVCWAFLTTGKNAIEVISHEVGHTLGLSHDGKVAPFAEYYPGQSGWAPIMGISYSQPLTHWSKGEYFNANNLQDDLLIIDTNNGVDYRADDHGSSFAQASWLNIDVAGLVSNEGIIETNTDRDSFQFSSNGGLLNLEINPIPPIPDGVAISNLDIRAELLSVTSTLSTVIATSNSTSSLAASFNGVSLDPGDYMLRVSGTGKGSPLTTGYSSYASLGSYTITGSVDGGIHAEQFAINENTANGTVVGSVPPRAGHGGGTLIYQISGGPFAIHPTNGQITVADQALLDFEALSTRWDDPADFELFVTIADSNDFALETIRTVVTLTDVNEPPVFPTPSAVKLPERSPPGTIAATMVTSDPDRADFVTYSITAGNVGNAFSIQPSTGVVTVAGPLDFLTTSSYALTIRASDQLSPVNEVDATLQVQLVQVPSGYNPGSVTRTFFSGIPGPDVEDLTGSPNFPDKPNSETLLTSFDGGSGQGSQYGSTFRGWLIAPTSGDYTFWISANDSASLLISTDADPQNATQRASLGSPTSPGVWDQELTQQSMPLTLAAGSVYYIEARHKQSTGGDHLQVAWQGPGMAAKQIIPGTWLVPFRQPYAPWAAPQSFEIRVASAENSLVGRIPFVEPNLDQQVVSHTVISGNEAENFTIDPVSGDIRVAEDAELPVGANFTLGVSATDDAVPGTTGSTTANIRVIRLDESLHAWWKLDETSGSLARDSSGNNRNATLNGSGTRISRAAANGALELNGTDTRLSHNDPESLEGQTPFSVSAWVRVPTGHDSEGTIIQHTSGRNSGLERTFRVSVTPSGTVRFRIYQADEQFLIENDQFDISTVQTIHDGTWHHIACVRDGQSGRIFIDGVESASGSGPIVSLDMDARTTVGCDTSANSAFLEATVDDVRIYADALSGEQILRILAAPKIAIVDPAVQSAVIPHGVGLLLEAAASVPTGPAATISWSQTSGPGIATFSPVSGPQSSVRFSAPGIYVLRATADNGTDDMSETLTILAGSTAITPFAGFSYGSTTTGSYNILSPSAITMEGTSAGINAGATQDGFNMAGQTFNGDFALTARVVATYDDGFTDPWGMAGLVVRSGSAGLPDEAGGFIGFNTTAGTGTWIRRTADGAPNVETSYPALTPPQWCRITRAGNIVEFWHSGDGTAWTSRGTMTLSGEVRAGLCWSSISETEEGSAIFNSISGFSISNTGAAVSAGIDFAAQTTLPSNLTGQIEDDGNPAPPANVNAAWELLSGPGTVAIAEPSQTETTAVFSQAGVYVLRLIADDGALRTFDEVTVTVTDPLPVVSVATTVANAAEIGPVFGAVTFTRSAWLDGDITVNFTLSGTADNSVDYETISESIVIPDGVETVTLDIIPLPDNVLEGPETIILTLDTGGYVIAGTEALVTMADPYLPPLFLADPIVAPGALQAAPYTGESLANYADDPNLPGGDSLGFEKISGPSWLSVAPDGTLSGTPGVTDLGNNLFTVRVTDATSLAVTGNLQINVTIPSTYADWQLAEFGAQASDPQVAGELVDPDDDGRVNLLEYAQDTDPNLPDAARTEIEMVDILGTPHSRVTYFLNPAATDLTLSAEATEDLSAPNSWTDANLIIEQQTPARLTVRDTTGGTRIFVRLEVTR